MVEPNWPLFCWVWPNRHHGSNLPKMGHHLSSRSAYHDRVAYSKSERHMAYGRVVFSVDDVKCERWLKVVTVPNWKWGGIRVLCACLVGWLVVAAIFTPSITCETLKQNMEISITYYVYYNLYFICTYFSFHSRKVSDLCRHARCNDYRIWK